MKNLHPIQIFLFLLLILPLVLYEVYKFGKYEARQECLESPFIDPIIQCP